MIALVITYGSMIWFHANQEWLIHLAPLMSSLVDIALMLLKNFT